MLVLQYFDEHPELRKSRLGLEFTMRFLYLLLAAWSSPWLAMRGVADEFPVKIPSVFHTEVLFEKKYDDSFSPTQFMVTEIQFNDFQNYRMVTSDTTTITRGFVEDGLNLSCSQSEKVVVGGQALTVSRKSVLFQGEVPKGGEALAEIIAERCRDAEWSVSFSTTDDLPNSLGRLHGLVALVGKLDFLSQDRSAFSIAKPSILKKSGDTIDAKIQDKGDSHRVTLQKWEEGWRVSRLNSTYSSPSMVGEYAFRANDSDLEMEVHWTKTLDTPESRASVRMTKIQFDGSHSIAMMHPISNGTPVSLEGSPQIRAVWMDGKVVRVYEGGTVDDLGSATFRTASGSSAFVRGLLITVCLAAAVGAVLWMRRKSK